MVGDVAVGLCVRVFYFKKFSRTGIHVDPHIICDNAVCWFNLQQLCPTQNVCKCASRSAFEKMQKGKYGLTMS